MFYLHLSVLSPFQRFISISAFYPYFSVLSPFQRFIPISVFYPHFSVLSPFQRFISISAFYPHFSVLSPFQRFIPISAFYPPFSFRFQFPFPPFSFSVLSRPVSIGRLENKNIFTKFSVTWSHLFDLETDFAVFFSEKRCPPCWTFRGGGGDCLSDAHWLSFWLCAFYQKWALCVVIPLWRR